MGGRVQQRKGRHGHTCCIALSLAVESSFTTIYLECPGHASSHAPYTLTLHLWGTSQGYLWSHPFFFSLHDSLGYCGKHICVYSTYIDSWVLAHCVKKVKKWQKGYCQILFPPGHPSGGQLTWQWTTGGLISTEIAHLRVSLLSPTCEAGKHFDHSEVLFPPLGQCTWVWVLSTLFTQ